MRKALRLPVAILAILICGTAGVVLFRAAANEKAHSVLLKWNPPAPTPGVTITKYNIYRSGPDPSFAPLASVTAPTYVDTWVSSGTTYHYRVTAVAASGQESPPSDLASAVIP